MSEAQRSSSVTRSRRLGLTYFLGLVLVGVLAAAGGIVSAQQRAPEKRTFDYWQPDWMVRELWGPGKIPKGMMIRMLRHSVFMQYGVPPEYEGAKSTVATGPDTIAAGGELYAKNCAACHGADGMGGGDASQAVSPSPALLAYMIRRPISVDEYLLWSIADGGKPFESDMPAFKDKLSRDDIWRVIAYMRAGFVQVEKGKQ